MTSLAVPIERARGYLNVVRSDSLVRNSVYMMASTVVTAGLGYIFWIVTAHAFTSAQVGIGSAVISLCSTVALLTYLGSWATLIERLHAYERTRMWTSVLARMCAATALVTAAVAAIAVPVLAHSRNYGTFFDAASAVALAVVGSAVWTLVNLFSAAFIAARRGDGLLTIQTLVSVVKLLLVLPIAAIGAGSLGIVAAWVGSALLGVVVGAAWLLPRLRLGRRPDGPANHRIAPGRLAADSFPSSRLSPASRPGPASRLGPAGRPGPPRPPSPPGLDLTTTLPLLALNEPRPYRGPRHRQSSRTNTFSFRRLIGQHLTSVGGAVTPLLLPIEVVLRLGVAPNAYFYITWMIGSIFFMVSPAIAASLFAESVRLESGLRKVVAKSFRVTALLLIPAMVVIVAGGKLILGLFGAVYAREGYGLLILLAISAVPDAVSNIAVAIFQSTGRLNYSSSLNIGILVVTIAAAWFLMPVYGIAGAGIAWLGAQALGAVASFPAFANLGRRVAA
jgi:O-antigen/teichoic acid export membrane protein